MSAASAGEPIHLRPKSGLARRVLLPGDPHRALAIAQDVLEGPLMFNHRRGLWGYTGLAADGAPLSVQSTGMGGPSAAIVVEELIALGAEVLVRVGTCGALDSRLALGELVAVEGAVRLDGASRALAGEGTARADPDLLERLASAGEARRGLAASVDLFYESEPPSADGAVAVEMEAATVLTLCLLRGVRGACLLGVTDVDLSGQRRRLDDEGYGELGLRLGRAAAAAVTGLG